MLCFLECSSGKRNKGLLGSRDPANEEKLVHRTFLQTRTCVLGMEAKAVSMLSSRGTTQPSLIPLLPYIVSRSSCWEGGSSWCLGWWSGLSAPVSSVTLQPPHL